MTFNRTWISIELSNKLLDKDDTIMKERYTYITINFIKTL